MKPVAKKVPKRNAKGKRGGSAGGSEQIRARSRLGTRLAEMTTPSPAERRDPGISPARPVTGSAGRAASRRRALAAARPPRRRRVGSAPLAPRARGASVAPLPSERAAARAPARRRGRVAAAAPSSGRSGLEEPKHRERENAATRERADARTRRDRRRVRTWPASSDERRDPAGVFNTLSRKRLAARTKNRRGRERRAVRGRGELALTPLSQPQLGGRAVVQGCRFWLGCARERCGKLGDKSASDARSRGVEEVRV